MKAFMEYIDDNVINRNFGFKLKAYNCIRLGNKAALQFIKVLYIAITFWMKSRCKIIIYQSQYRKSKFQN